MEAEKIAFAVAISVETDREPFDQRQLPLFWPRGVLSSWIGEVATGKEDFLLLMYVLPGWEWSEGRSFQKTPRSGCFEKERRREGELI